MPSCRSICCHTRHRYKLSYKLTCVCLDKQTIDGVVFEGAISSLKRFKDDAREVAQGYEAGIGLERYNDVKEGDILEAYILKEVQK